MVLSLPGFHLTSSDGFSYGYGCQSSCNYFEAVIFRIESVSEAEALYELYKRISSSITDDRLIHKLKEMVLALLHELELVLPDDFAEIIVNKVKIAQIYIWIMRFQDPSLDPY